MANRRQYLFGAGTAAAALVGVGVSNTVLAQNTTPENIYITNVNEEGEYFVVENRNDSPFDLTNYHVNFEYNGEVNQVREFGPDTTTPEGQNLTIEAGGRFVIATGAKEVADADVVFDYAGSVLNNDMTDTYAILTPDQSRVIARSDQAPPTSTATPNEEATTTKTDATTTETATTETTATTDTPTAEPTTAETTTQTTTDTPPSTTAGSTQTATAEPTETPDGTTTEMPDGVDIDDGC